MYIHTQFLSFLCRCFQKTEVGCWTISGVVEELFGGSRMEEMLLSLFLQLAAEYSDTN